MRVYYPAHTNFNGKVERMTKKEFIKRCTNLEKDGWTLVGYDPKAKIATYFKNGVFVNVK